MMSLGETMLELRKDLPKAKTPHEQESIKRTIAVTDRGKILRVVSRAQGGPAGRIDALVYEPCSLTEDEIRIVEGGGHA